MFSVCEENREEHLDKESASISCLGTEPQSLTLTFTLVNGDGGDAVAVAMACGIRVC